MEVILKENQELKKKLVASMRIEPVSETNTEFSILNLLLECAKENAGKKPGGWRYNDVLKDLAFLIFSLGGVALYEILCHHENFPFPSVTTIKKKIYSNDKFVEGEYRIKHCKEFLLSHDCPLEVFLCEDATCVTGRIQYDSTSNQVVGFPLPFDHNGIPQVGHFPAINAHRIADYFKDHSPSRYAYCIMAVPLKDGIPSFCLSFFGTDNKFTAAQVKSRFKWTREALAKEGIKVAGNGSDGDTRLLSTMCQSVITPNPAAGWRWFSARKKAEEIYIQDHIHIGAKLKSRLLKPSVILPLGKDDVASRGHLVEFIRTVSRDQHELTLNHIDVKDKMNYRAVQMLTDKKVTNLLRLKITNSQGTALYLDMIREIIDSFTKPSLLPLERVSMIWKWVFFLRFWRAWISDSNDYTVKNNFITSNAYACIEINAHCLIQHIISLRDSESHSSFLPWRLSSQECEKTFRILRSSVASHCGVVSFSILDLENYFRKLDLLASTYVKLDKVVHFPRKRKVFATSDEAPHIPICLPEDFEISSAVCDSLKEALDLAKKFNLVPKNCKQIIPMTYLRERARLDPGNALEELDDDAEIDSMLVDNLEEEEDDSIEAGEGTVEESSNVIEDLFMASSGSLGVRKYNNVNLSESSPFVLVCDGFKAPAIIRKSTFCWLLSSGDTKLSSDRLLRVMTKPVQHSLSLISRKENLQPTRENVIHAGDWCAFVSETNSVAIGRVMSFSYLTGTSVSQQEYRSFSAPTKAPDKNARGIGCHCTWFYLKKNSRALLKTDMEAHGYYEIDKYICTLPRPEYKQHCSTNLFLSCNARDILKFKINV